MRVCRVCKKTVGYKESFCSRTCEQVWYKINGNKYICDCCGDEYYGAKKLALHDIHFCTNSCKEALKKNKKHKKYNNKKHDRCFLCDEIFSGKRYRKNNKVYCSKQCKRVGGMSMAVSYYRICKECGKYFVAYGGDNYCSDLCKKGDISCNIWKSRNKKVEPIINDEETDFIQEINNNKLSKPILPVDREYYLEKYNYTCQCCEKIYQSEDLDCHHILWVMLGGQNGDENIIVLCSFCHHKQHVRDVYVLLKGHPEHSKGIFCERVEEIRGDMLCHNPLKPLYNACGNPYNSKGVLVYTNSTWGLKFSLSGAIKNI